ncbi:class I SAM-dependent DNA methyltransferase [Actinoplanes sp. CA-054009]
MDFAESYDDLNPDDHDHRFYAALAAELGATSALDLGCGTGTLARLLAATGRTTVGIDPDPEMLRVARSRPSTDRVDWRLGHSNAATPNSADFAVMSGHVAQVFRNDEAWARALRDLRRALVPQGNLAFESRNPAARAWKRWTRAATLRTLDGHIDFWHETVEVALPLVTYDTFTHDRRTGEREVTRDVLAFRDAATLERSLEEAGFTVTHRFGDWDRRPLTAESREIILVGRA